MVILFLAILAVIVPFGLLLYLLPSATSIYSRGPFVHGTGKSREGCYTGLPENLVDRKG